MAIRTTLQIEEELSRLTKSIKKRRQLLNSEEILVEDEEWKVGQEIIMLSSKRKILKWVLNK